MIDKAFSPTGSETESVRLHEACGPGDNDEAVEESIMKRSGV